jgi:hypothetical protein
MASSTVSRELICLGQPYRLGVFLGSLLVTFSLHFFRIWVLGKRLPALNVFVPNVPRLKIWLELPILVL